MSLTEDIKKAIEAQLPAAVGDVLKQRLVQADQLEAHNTKLLASVASGQDQIRALERQLQAHAALTAREGALVPREAALTAREQSCALNEVRLECATARITDLKEVTLAVFRNNHFKYTRVGERAGGCRRHARVARRLLYHPSRGARERAAHRRERRRAAQGLRTFTRRRWRKPGCRSP